MQRKRTYPPKGDEKYHQLWRLVDGAVVDALNRHPEYVGAGIHTTAIRVSITKRVVGALMSFQEEGSIRVKKTGG